MSASQSLGSRFKTRQDPDSLTYSKIAASAVLMSGVFRGFGISGLGIGEKGFVSKQLHSSRLHYNDVEWGAFAYPGIWESGQMLGVHSRPSDTDVKWQSREQDWGRFYTCLVILWTLIEKRRLEISRCLSMIITRYKDFTWATVRLPYPWVTKN